jgi:hypothetical protein
MTPTEAFYKAVEDHKAVKWRHHQDAFEAGFKTGELEALRTTLEKFVDLIACWNNLGKYGPTNKALVLILWDDGSGQIGDTYGPDREGVNKTSLENYLINRQHEFKDLDGAIEYLKEWIE